MNFKRLKCWLMLHDFDKFINKEHIECVNCGMVVNNKGIVNDNFLEQYRKERIVAFMFPIVILSLIVLWIVIS